MLATIARTAAVEAAIEEPTVTYNAVQRQIAGTVVASLPPGSTEPVFEAPLIAIPGPGKGSDLWTVVWTLVPGFGVSSAIFTEENGIELPGEEELPPKLRIMESFRVPDHPDQWQATFQNSVVTANSFSYGIQGVVTSSKGQLRFRHDPTIVVTQDPIG